MRIMVVSFGLTPMAFGERSADGCECRSVGFPDAGVRVDVGCRRPGRGVAELASDGHRGVGRAGSPGLSGLDPAFGL